MKTKTLIKPLAIIIFTFVTISFACAKDRDLYAGASADVRERIQNCQNLIEQKQYASANSALGEPDSEYIVLKRTELYTDYFLVSFMHQAFALKNLEEDEDLDELRYQISYGSGDVEFNITFFDPLEEINSYVQKNGSSPATSLAVAHYYFDTLQRYGSNWLEPVEDMILKATQNYKEAYEQDFYDYKHLNEYAGLLMSTGQYRESSKIYETALTLVDDDARTWFNYAATLYFSNNIDKTITAVKNAIKYRDPVDEYHIDAYTLLTEAYYKKGDWKNATKTIQAGLKEFPQSAVLLLYEGSDYLKNKKASKAKESYKKAYAIDSSDATLKEIMQAYYEAGYFDEGVTFCLEAVETKKDDPAAQSMLYYMAFQMQFVQNNLDAAEELLVKAEEALAQATDPEYARQTFEEIRASFR